MKTVLYKAVSSHPGVQSLERTLKRRETPVLLTGLSAVHKALLAGALSESHRIPLLLTGDEAEGVRLTDDLRSMGCDALFYPARDIELSGVESASREYEQQRLSVLGRLSSRSADCVVASAEAASQLTMPPDFLISHTIEITPGHPLPTADLAHALTLAGYTRCERVESAGQFAVRGGIIDIFPSDSDSPVRLELWGDEVDSLSYFDVASQRRTETAEGITVPPAAELLCDSPEELAEKITSLARSLRGRQTAAKEWLIADADRLQSGIVPALDRYLTLLYSSPASLFDYLPGSLVLISEWSKVQDHLRASHFRLHEEIESLLARGLLCKTLDTFMLSPEEIICLLRERQTVICESFVRTVKDLPVRSTLHLDFRQLPPFSGALEMLCDDLREFLHRGAACIVLAGTEEKAAKALAGDLHNAGLPALFAPNPEAPVKNRVLVTTGGLSSGADLVQGQVVLLTHGRPVLQRKRRLAPKKNRGAPVGSLDELRNGNYVVHAAHGIGIYRGIHRLEMQGIVKDYLKLEYAGGDNLYVPVTQMDLVSKYIGAGDGAAVRLHRLGSSEWQKAKSRVRAEVQDIAKDLIALYAKRMATKGFAFAPDDEWQYDFERHFIYEETEDQLRCAEEIREDMQRPVPMDRLLCGDVGFGKTEVALRAAFRCVSQGKQCVMLVPTTILAYQHYNTVCQRFEGFPVTVEMLSRFRTPKQQEDILRRTERGEIDILIGTHRLLSEDVKMRDLGLFIVDEEQRFGVSQKEKIKERYPAVDVLTLSATPIPRTMHMAMSGIRDMSVIEEAPQDRHPVQTYVLEQDNGILADAIRRELRRGGQVYYLHNRIDTIARCASGLRERIPEARIAVAHGRMSEEELSDIWRQVMDQEVDILVCTTIIETGVDIPNVNTLIIENADRYGLSQLHQLRGRVGRSSRRAYAYLTFSKGKVLDETASKRLEAIREFTEFGAGFHIAMRDMEIRGAGNLLGAQQHGHMEAVGYDLYLKLLAEAVSEQKGETPVPSEEDCVIDLPVSTHIPDSYIRDSSQRLDIYRRIADIRTEEDSLDVMDELIDRFGEPPETVQGLVDVALLRNMAASLGIREVKEQNGSLLLYPRKLDLPLAHKLSSALKGRVMISAGAKPYYAVRRDKKFSSLDTLREALRAMQAAAESPGTAKFEKNS